MTQFDLFDLGDGCVKQQLKLLEESIMKILQDM